MLLCCGWLGWLELIFLLMAVYLIYMCWHFRLFSKQGIPVAGTPIPILGTTLPVFRKGFVDGVLGNIEKYGKTHGGFLGRKPELITVDTDILREIFIKDHASFPNRNTLSAGDPLDGNMLQNITDYAHWKSLRSTMTPAFSSGKLKRMMKQMNKCASTYAMHLTKEPGKSMEMKEFAGSFSMDVIASTAFGLDLNTKDDRNNPFVQHASNGFDFQVSSPLLLVMFFLPFLMPLLRPFKLGFIDRACKEFFTGITHQVLDSRKESKADGVVDFIQLMMNAHKDDDDEDKEKESKRAMTRQELVSQAVLFFLAGYDTTATSLCFLAYNLACHPDKQDKLIEEVQRVLADKEDLSDEDVQEMPYMDMCVSESLRLFPPAPRIDRVADRDVVIKGIYLPKGSSVVAPVYLMHHLAEFYPDPEAFIPERFSAEEKGKRDPLLYMPFGAGPRQCIATRLALLELKIAVSHVLRTHRFVNAPETQVPIKFEKFGGLLKGENGVWLRLEEHGC